jgi:hypothetical protein
MVGLEVAMKKKQSFVVQQEKSYLPRVEAYD